VYGMLPHCKYPALIEEVMPFLTPTIHARIFENAQDAWPWNRGAMKLVLRNCADPTHLKLNSDIMFGAVCLDDYELVEMLFKAGLVPTNDSINVSVRKAAEQGRIDMIILLMGQTSQRND